MEEKRSIWSRRGFIGTLSGVAAGLLVGIKGPKLFEAEAFDLNSLPPWPYKRLHSTAVAKKVSDLYLTKREYDALKSGTGVFTGMCCNEAVFEGVIKSSGYSLPAALLGAFGGGVSAWGCLCGALTGGLAVIGCFHGKITRDTKSSDVTFPLGQKLMDWFTKTQGAPCCHVSVSSRAKQEGWHGQKWGSPDHYYSCALLSGRVAEYTIDLLNAEADGKFTAYKPPEYTKGCATCHNPMSGVSDCFACHDQKSYSAKPHTHAPVDLSIRNPKQPNYMKKENGYLREK